MRAAVLHKTGGIESLEDNLRVEEVPMPRAEDDDVTVKVKWASLNRRDLWIAKGQYAKIRLPVIPGSDCAGTVYALGRNVKNFREGDAVLVNPSIDWGESELHQSADYSILGMPSDGTFAEYVRVKSRYVHAMPAHLDHRSSAALPLAGITAYRALFARGRLREAENVLITGIGGGVATLALQFAVSAGANVFVTSGSTEKLEQARSLGSSGGALYTEKDWTKKIRELAPGGIQLIIDGAGGNTLTQLLETVDYGGRIVSYGSTLGYANEVNLHRIFWKQLNVLGSTMGSETDFLNMLSFVNDKKITPVTDSEYELESVTGAFRRMERSGQFGKILLRIS